MKPIGELTRKYKVEEINGSGYRDPQVYNAKDAKHAVDCFVYDNQIKYGNGYLSFPHRTTHAFKVTVLATGETLEFGRKF